MASHRRLVKHFSRKSGPRKALIRGLMVSLVEHGRIKTTVTRAKEVRRHIEKAITLGKKGNLNSTRLLVSRLANKDSAVELVKSISPRFKDRPGGYTRVIKIGRRPGDAAEMAFLEFVDYDFKAVASETKSAKTAKPTKAKASAKSADKKSAKTELTAVEKLKVAGKVKKLASLAQAKTKKGIRKTQNKSRADHFALSK